jgi:hypothetical protein
MYFPFLLNSISHYVGKPEIAFKILKKGGLIDFVAPAKHQKCGLRPRVLKKT